MAERPPVLLVPGFSGQDLLYWNVMHHRLERDGFRAFTTTFPRLTMQDMRLSARRLGERVEEILAATGAARLHMLGHSMGGLIMRYYTSRLGGDTKVASMVTVGTPHQGTYWGFAGAITEAGRQLLPGSEFLRELPAPNGHPPLLNIYGNRDLIVLPASNAVLPGGNNHRVRVAGHWSLLLRDSVYREARSWFEAHSFPDVDEALGAG